MIRVRFAPALAGGLLVGGVRVALANDLFARRGNGRLLLRLDDLDADRCREGAAEQILQELRWFGIDWHDSVRQSERLGLYQPAIERLKRDKFIYPCFESEEELKAKAEFRRKRNQPLIYDRAMLALTDKQRRDAEAGGKRPHWRFKLSGRTLEWKDLVQGGRRATLSAVSDPILVRADGSPTPLLASVVDDLEYKTTHIIRGDDNAGNTAVQIELLEVLYSTPARIRFGHLPALQDSSPMVPGGRRVGSLALRALRQDGVEPGAIAACLVDAAEEDAAGLTPAALPARFSLADLARPEFDVARMLRANRRILQGLDFNAVADRLPAGATEAFWLAVRGELDLLKEARGWWNVAAGDIIPPVIEGARDLLLTAAALLPAEPWDHLVWGNWIEALERTPEQMGGTMEVKLRLALTGEDSGPELANLLPLIGRARAISRLENASA